MKRFLVLFANLMASYTFTLAQYEVITPSGHLIYYQEEYDGGSIVGVTIIPSYYETPNYTGDLVIPDSIYTWSGEIYPVTKIGEGAFLECEGLTSVVIPNTVLEVENHAFYGCTNLDNVTLSDNITSIGYAAFCGCESLSTVNLPSTLTELGEAAFRETAITAITIPTGLSEIPNQAFFLCGQLQSVTIPSSVSKIGRYAFGYCRNIRYVNFLGTVDQWNSIDIMTFMYGWDGGSWGGDEANPIRFARRLFINGQLLTDLSFSDTVTHIGNNFRYDTALTSLTMHNGIASMAPLAFDYCIGLENITLSSGLDSLKTRTFYGCARLSQLNIPSSIVYIGDSVFFGTCCRVNMQSQAPPSLGVNTFAKLNSSYTSSESLCTEKITVPCGSYNSYYSSWRRALRSRLQEGTLAGAVVISNNTAWGGASKTAQVGCAIVVQASPLQHYQFSHWSTGSTLSTDTIRQTDTDTIIAYFVPATYTITGLANNRDRGSVEGGGNAHYLDTIALLANPNYGYKFTRWNDFSTDNPKYVPVTGNKTLTAYFDYEKFTITLGTTDSNKGSVNGSGEYNYLSHCTINATANYGYHFESWSDGNISNPRTIVLTKDTCINATFSKNRYSISGTSSHPSRGSVEGSDSIDYLDTITLTAIANYGYSFTQWNDGNAENPRQVIATQNKTYTAQFAYNQYSIALIANQESFGSVTGSGFFNYLTDVSIHASPNAGYHFVHWGDGVIHNPRIIQLTQDTVFTAVFAPNIYRIMGVPSNSAQGYVEGSDTVEYLSTVILTAIPNHGFNFSHWQDGVTDNPRQITATSHCVYYAYFDTNQYTIVASPENTTFGTVSGGGTFNYLSTRTVQALENGTHYFSRWSDGSTENPYTFTLTQDTTLTAHYHTLTLTAGNNGNVNHTRNGYCTAIISATANSNHHFSHWSDGNTDNPRTVTLTQDTTITAIFAPNQYTITGAVNSSQRGTVDGVGIYNYGDTATLTAVPNYGYKFTRWGDYEYDNPRRVVVRQDRTYTAYFDYDQFDITVGVDDASHGYATGGGRFNYMSSRTVQAYENGAYGYGDNRYYFAHWSDGSTDNPYTFTLTQDTTLTAHYYTLTATADSTGYVSQTKTGTLTVRLNASPDYGYHFTHWNDGSTENPRWVTLTQDTTFSAHFAPNQYTLTVVSSDVNMGSVSGSGTYYYGDIVTLTATPASHYHFVCWNDGNTENPRQYRVWGEVTVTAFFAIDTHTVSVASNDIARGMVEASGTQFEYGQPCTVTATAYSGYTFHSWSNGMTDNPYTFAVLSDVELTANFIAAGEQVYTITVQSADPTMGTVSGGGQALRGGTLTIRAQGNAGYRFLRWQDGNTDSVRTVTVTGNATYTAYFSETVGIEEVSVGDELQVWVSDGCIHVRTHGREAEGFEVYDVMGRLVAAVAAGRDACVPVPAGVYLVRVAGLPARKVVVMR